MQWLCHRAMHDPLTGLSNRADFQRELWTVFRKAHHLDRPAAVMMVDLDRFKVVNDAAGHAAGDAVLCRVAEACRMTVRSSDVVARLGGARRSEIVSKLSPRRCSRPHIGHVAGILTIELSTVMTSVTN
jgi:diguanylate cyclase (GGDEF)-like protein